MHDEQGTVLEQRVFLRAHSVHVVTGLWLRRIGESSDMVSRWHYLQLHEQSAVVQSFFKSQQGMDG
jgi:hypothetical protein